MRRIFLLACLVSTLANAENIVELKVVKIDEKPIENFRLNVTESFRFDSNTTLNDNALFKGKYDSDIGAIYKFDEVDSMRFSLNNNNESANIRFRHRF